MTQEQGINVEIHSLKYLEEHVFPLEGIVDTEFITTRPKLDLFLNGNNGNFVLTPSSENDQRLYKPLSNLPLGLTEEFAFPHDLQKELEETYLLPPSHFPLPLIEKAQHVALCEETKVDSLFQLKLLPPQVQVESKWDPITGQHLGCSVVSLQDMLCNPFLTSSSKSLEKDKLNPLSSMSPDDNNPTLFSFPSFHSENDPITLLKLPPGLDRGIMFPELSDDPQSSLTSQTSSLMDLAMKPMPLLEAELLQPLVEEGESEIDEEEEKEKEKENNQIQGSPSLSSSTLQQQMDHAEDTLTSLHLSTDDTIDTLTVALDKVLPEQPPVPLPLSSPPSKLLPHSKGSRHLEWAHVVTDPMLSFETLVPDLAIPFPFTLDVFQKQAIYHLEQGHSVFVAAHTSAGKTVVAEYAIGLSQHHRTKTIYTSPIKALSNQKFRDLSSKFNVGLLTGDVQLNTQGDCLIMTTEILRSMLYKNAELLRDVEFVIFDEVHYVNDIDRGVVWEEVIILLPTHVTLILLSATVPNVQEFADWVGRTHQKPVHVISTATRPVPLEHYLYIPPAKEYFKVVDAKQKFLEDGWKLAVSKFSSTKSSSSSSTASDPSKKKGNTATTNTNANKHKNVKHSSGGFGGSSSSNFGNKHNFSSKPEKNTFVHLTYLLKERGLLPTVIFTFSRKNCEVYADFLSSMDLLSNTEKAGVHAFVQKSISKLPKHDQSLPQILRMKDMLHRGLGVHHGGLLPLIKEMVEILFAQGLVKMLFATETFAMGVNMPAKCVVFSSTRKNDGTQFRELLPGEYIQMSGRAGRRGLDSTGMVLVLAMTPPMITDFFPMVLGTPTQLRSQFRLTFNMILNLLRASSLHVEDMMKHSFFEHATMQTLASKQKSLDQVTRQLNNRSSLDCLVCQVDLQTYHDVSELLIQHQDTLHTRACQSPIGMKTMVPGRVVVIRSKKLHNVVGVVVHRFSTKQFMVTVLVPSTDAASSPSLSVSVKLNLPPTHVMAPTLSSCSLTTLTVSVTDLAWVTEWTVPTKLVSKQPALLIGQLHQYATALQTSGQFHAMRWEKKIKDVDFHEHMDACERHFATLSTLTCLHCPDFLAHYAWMHDQAHLEHQWSELHSLVGFQQLSFLPDYHARLSILQALQYVDDEGQVLLKGRVACEVHSGHELVFTELVFHNFFAALDVPETVAMLSLFLCQEKGASANVTLATPALLEALEQWESMDAELRVLVEQEHGLALPSYNPSLMDVAYAWAQGISFQQIMPLANGILEGSIVRTILRIEEACRELKDAARLMGDANLFLKMQACSTAIKRDIVFCGSLYFE